MNTNVLKQITDGRTDLVFDYLAAGHAATSTDKDGTFLIKWCAYYGDVSAIRFLIIRGESLRSLGDNFDLNGAAFHGHWRLCQFLIELGADVDQPLPDTGESPLHAALCTSDRLAHDLVLKVLLGNGANPNCATRPSVETGGFMRDCRTKGETPLHRAAAFGTAETIQMLLDAGAEVDAEADVYGRGATTLALAVTSSHPRAAGLQIPLADLLVERGARIDPDIVKYSLMNGCPEAAAHMALRGAPVGFEDAAGINRVDLLATHFEPGRRVAARDAAAALVTAAWYGQRDAVAFLLDHGVDPAARRPHEGSTALHVASYSGYPALVELLLERGAPVNVNDAVYGTPPLVWAMHAWLAEGRRNADDYRAIIRRLLDAGAEVKAEWVEQVRRDAELHAEMSRRL